MILRSTINRRERAYVAIKQFKTISRQVYKKIEKNLAKLDD